MHSQLTEDVANDYSKGNTDAYPKDIHKALTLMNKYKLLKLDALEETRLLRKMSPASHFFFFEKVEKNNDNKSVHSCRRYTSGKLSVPLLVPDVFSRNRTVVYAIACDRMRSHAIACDRMQSHAMVPAGGESERKVSLRCN